MGPVFKFKTESIKYLAVNGGEINTLSKLDDYFNRGEQLLHLFIDEINNNKYNLKLEYSEYLIDLKNELWSFFLKDSYQMKNQKTIEYNLLTYFADYQKYNEKFNLQEYRTLKDLCTNNLDLIARNSLEDLFSQEQKAVRKIGELPYTVYAADHLTNYIKIIEGEGKFNHLRWCIQTYNDPYYINDSALRFTYYRVLLICTEEIRTHFLWIIIGKVLTTLKALDSSEKTIESHFKDPEDYKKLAGILRDLGVIGNDNSWQGVRIIDPRTRVEKKDPTKTAVVALIQCLDSKQYLRHSTSTARGIAFCKAFDIVLTNRALLDTPKNSQLYFDFFSRFIPDRSNLLIRR